MVLVPIFFYTFHYSFRSWPNSAVWQTQLFNQTPQKSWWLRIMDEIILITVDPEILLMTNHVCRCLYMWVFSIYKCMFSDILLLHRTTGIYSNTNNTLHLIYRADIAVSIVLPACTNLLLKNFVPPSPRGRRVAALCYRDVQNQFRKVH